MSVIHMYKMHTWNTMFEFETHRLHNITLCTVYHT
jgi:hypothetical protein